ncbi:MAG: GMC family oxidoreductase [Myxococcota bacterium]
MTVTTYDVLSPYRRPTQRVLPDGLYTRDQLTRDTTMSCDVAIVGSGAGGGTLAAELAEAGVDVVVLEEGSYFRTEDFGTDATGGARQLYREMGTTMTFGLPPVLYQEGCTVGGSTVINGGMSWRTPEAILDRWGRDHHVERLSARDLDGLFSRVEKRINVAFQDEESHSRDSLMFKEGADQKGWNIIPNLRNQVHCAGTNNCAFGCPTGAKRSVLLTYVPRALHYGARLLANVRVAKIMRKGKRAVGVQGRVVKMDGTAGPRVTVHAKMVVSSCGAIHTPALLKRSGFRVPSRMIGRNLWLHPNAKVVAVFDEDVRGWQGAHQSFQIREFDERGILMAAVNVPPGIVAMTTPLYGDELGNMMQDYNRMLVAGLLVEDTSSGRVVTLPGGKPMPLYALSKSDAETLQWGVCKLCELLLDMGARAIFMPFEGVAPLRSRADLEALKKRKIARSDMEVVTVHLMGTARMGEDRTSSVTNSYGLVHDTDRLMVCDASLFPTPIGVNPALTIQTLATRNAVHILENRRRYLA